ncbi:MAG: regulatory protein RecX [Coriobacteriales bacterium]
MKMHLTKGGAPVAMQSLFELTPEPGEPLFLEQEHIKAMDKIAALVRVRERTPKELLGRLVEGGFSPEVAQEAVDSAVRCGLVDEERYAAALIRGKVSQGWGRAKIMARLRQDGVSPSAIERCSQYFATPQQEYERALYELGKRSVRSKNPRATLTRRLVQKGYSPELANRAVEEFMYGASES